MSNKAVAFIRVSTKGQEKKISFDNQQEEIKRYCLEKKLKIVQTFTTAESAKDSIKRLQYHEAIAYVLKNKIPHLIFYSYDREARNLTDCEYNEKLAREGTLTLHYARERKLLDKDSPGGDFLSRDFHGILNKKSSIDLGIVVRANLTTKAEKGWYPSNKIPLGYKSFKKSRSTHATTIVDPDQLKVRQVQREFELRSQGLSFDHIATMIKEEGFTYQVKATTIQKRISNPFYGGNFLWKNKIYKGLHELIIPTDIYNKAMQTMGTRGQTKNLTHPLGSSFLKCSECGCSICYDPKTKVIKSTGLTVTYHYFHCTNAKKVHEKLQNITAESIWEQLEGSLESITLDPDLAELIVKELNKDEIQFQRSLANQIEQLKRDLDINTKDQNQTFDYLLHKTISREVYEQQSKRINEERTRLEIKLRSLEERKSDNKMETALSIIELAKNAKSLWKSMDDYERVKLLKSLLSNQEIDGLSVCFKLKKPFEILSQMASNVQWRSLRDSNPRPIGSKPTTLSS